MLFKRYTSLLVSTSIFVQAASPAFAMLEEETRQPRSKISISKIQNISEMDQTAGIVVQPGDWVLLDIDETVLKRGRDDNQDILNLDPKVVEMVKNWQALNKLEPNSLKHITVMFLTARQAADEENTREQLKKIGFPEDIEIIFAPNMHRSGQKTPTKGSALNKRLEKEPLKPRRLIMIDNLAVNLRDVFNAHQNNKAHKHIPLKLLKRKTNTKIFESPDLANPFPKKLTDLTYIRPIGGGSGGVHVLQDSKGLLFTLKSAGHSEQMKEEILADGLYRSLGIKVPAFAVYDYLPDIQEIREACTGPGPYRLAQFIEKDEKANAETCAKKMRKHFVADALFSNFDIVIGNFKNVELDKQGNLWRLDNGGSLRFRACGSSKLGLDNWNAHEVKELETMRQTPEGASVYGSLTEEELKGQVQKILSKSPALFSALDEMAKKLQLTAPGEVKEMLRRRLDYLVERYLLTPPSPGLQVFDGFVAPRFGAGVLSYSIDPLTHQMIILLGKRIGHRWWCNFGGSSDLNKGSLSDRTLADTAVREVQEESLGYLSYTPQELETMPSHGLLNNAGVFYRMYLAPHPYVAPEQLESAIPVSDYGWKEEYSEYRWVPLDQFLWGLEQNHLVKEESKETIKIGDMILYPHFWTMLKEQTVIDTLTNICAGKKVRAKHSHDNIVQTVSVPLSLEEEKYHLADVEVKKSFVLGEIKNLRPQSYVGTPKPSLKKNNQKNALHLFIENGALFIKPAHQNPIRVAPFTDTIFATDELNYIRGQLYQRRDEGQKLTLLPTEFYHQIVSYVKMGTALSDEENDALMHALGLDTTFANNKSEHSEEVRSMAGFLPDHEAEALRDHLLRAPYTQGQAYLRHRMGQEVYDTLGGSSELEVDTFLKGYSYFKDTIDPSDLHYTGVLKQAQEAEKHNRDKIEFRHATDPLTCFLWDIFTAQRSRLRNLGASELTTFRILEKKFTSIFDVEVFIQKYQENGSIDNYKEIGDIHYADCGMSVNPFGFGNDGNATSATYYLFYNTASVAPTNQEKLFNAFMTFTGIPGKFKDYKALFQQYYLRNNKENSKLFQIFIDPQVVDCVSYMAVSGGDVLTVDMDGQPYHGFAKTMAELRYNPEAGNEKIQHRTSGKLYLGRDLNNLQGRLYLKPEIFLDPRYMNGNTWWRHPFEEEASFYKKLNGQVSQDDARWLPQHDRLDLQSFVEGIPALKMSYRYAYEGVMALPYREKELKSLLLPAIKDGNFQLLEEILEKNPDIDINDPVQKMSYRGYAATTCRPFETLTVDTPHFSEIIKIFVVRGLKNIAPIYNAELYDKILNELFIYESILQSDLLDSFHRVLTGAPTSTDLIKCVQKKYINLVSYVFDWMTQLHTAALSSGQGTTFIEIVLANTSLQSRNRVFEFINILDQDDEKTFQAAPWFKVLWDEYSSFPVEILEVALRKEQWPYIAKIINNVNKTNYTLDLSKLYIPQKQETQWFQALAEGLKENEQLQGLMLPIGHMISVISDLMSSPAGLFTNAPWFQAERESIFQSPKNYLEYANQKKNYGAILTFLKQAPGEIPLGQYFCYPYLWLDSLSEDLAKDGPYSHINLSGINIGFSAHMPKLAEALKTNTNLKSLNLEDSKLFINEIPFLAEGLMNNKTLEKLFLSQDHMTDLMGELMKEPHGQFWNAPWFKAAWQTIIEQPAEAMKHAIQKKYHALLFQLSADAQTEALDLSSMFSYDRSEISFIFKGLKQNSKIQKLTIKSGDFSSEAEIKELITMLQSNNTFKCLAINQNYDLNTEAKGLLIEMLKTRTSLEDLVLLPDTKLGILNGLFSAREHLPEGIKKWTENALTELLADPIASLKKCLRVKDAKDLIPMLLETMTELKLTDIYSSPDVLFEGLKTNNTISVLDLEFCDFYAYSPTQDLAKILKETSAIHTLRLHHRLSSVDAKALSEALIANKTFETLELLPTPFRNNVLTPEVLAILGDAMKQTNFSKTLKVSAENEIPLLNELLSLKNQMSSHWLEWLNPLWEKLSSDPKAALKEAIRSGNKTLALSILEMGLTNEVDMEDTYLRDAAKSLLMEILKTDQGLQSIKIEDYGHKIFMELLPLKDSLSKGVQNWIESICALIETPEKAIQEILEESSPNFKLVEFILDRSALTRLSLSEMCDDKISQLFYILTENIPLETIHIAGDINRYANVLRTLTRKESFCLKHLDLSKCYFRYNNKINKSSFSSVEDLLGAHEGLKLILSQEAFKEDDLAEIQASPFVESGRLVIEEQGA